MANKTAKSTDEIQQLLDERRKILQWLDRLNMAGADTPSDVRERVRSDYESRLASVADELKGFTEELQETLATHQAQQAELADAQSAAEARMAEAKLRHAVGEFPESKWNDIHSDILSELVSVREELKTAEEEIGRLEEVLNMVQAPSVPSPPPLPPRVEPAPAPPPASSRSSGSHERFDELAFLKSVSEDERQGPAASRAHGPEKVAHEPMRSVRVSQEQPAIPELHDDGRDSSAGPKKTLKCGECGVMNFPTEWYCERCGAELAAL
jgi:hypothetical protein